MKLDLEQIEKLAKLCRIECSEEELHSHAKNFEGIMAHIEQLSEVATDDVEPCHQVTEGLSCPQREDEPLESLDRETFLANSPSHVGGMVRVPPVIKF